MLDSVDPNAEIWRHELGADQALHGVGTVPSWGAIEQVLKEEGMSFERHDSAALNVDIYQYDWVSTNSGRVSENMSGGMRRFYFARKLG